VGSGLVTGAAAAVGCLGPEGPWVGFAPALDDGYALVVGDEKTIVRSSADADDLLSLAIAYFEDALDAAPDELAATHGDIGALVRHLAEHETHVDGRRKLSEAVDAVDDGLAADVVVGRLTVCLEGGEDPIARLRRRATELLEA
jgi:hypothetical protein